MEYYQRLSNEIIEQSTSPEEHERIVSLLEEVFVDFDKIQT